MSTTPKKATKKANKSSAKTTPNAKPSPARAPPPPIREPPSHFRVCITANDEVSDYKLALRALICPEDMKLLRMRVGDLVALVGGERSGPAVLWASAAVGSAEIHLDPVLCVNLGLRSTSKVSIEKWKSPILPALNVILRATSESKDSLWVDEGCQLMAREVLRDVKYITENQVVEFIYQGMTRQFRVEGVSSKTAVTGTCVHEFAFKSTVAVLPFSKGETQKWGSKANISYESVGGLQSQIATIRKLVEVPLKDPQRFIKYGIKPPRGVLLYGPPGTGKTLIARAIACETGAHVIVINGPEIISKFYGETEERLRAIFREAEENAPAIIFIDEIDSLCPKRDDSATDLEKRIVTTLLTLMDGSDLTGKQLANGVMVMAATNRPNHLDDALRRPGRFDREVEIGDYSFRTSQSCRLILYAFKSGIPNAADRLQILQMLLRNTPHSLSLENIAEISGAAHGFVGADLAAVCKEAGMRTIRRVVEMTESENVSISLEDMKNALGVVKPSSMREVLLEVPNVRWTDIGGQEDIKQRIKEAVEWPLKHPEAFARFKIRPPKGILMYGPPGCSKTLMAKALATEAGLNFLAVKGPELFSKWVGESEKAVRDIFKKARAASPSVIFFDEIDAIAVRRGNDNGSVSDRVLSQLLNEMDGIEPLVNGTVIAATNRPDILDSALLRPGRMDRILYVSPPDYESRLQIFKIRIAKMTCASDVDCEALALKTEGYSGAETVSVCQEAAMCAMEEDPDAEAVCNRHFLDAISKVTPRITSEMIAFYDKFREESGLRSVSFCADDSNSLCLDVSADAATSQYIFNVTSPSTGWAGVGLGKPSMTDVPVVIGWTDSKGNSMQSTRYSPGHGQPHTAPKELISMIHAAAQYGGAASTNGIAYSFGVSFNDIATILGVMPDGQTPIDFIYAYNNIVPVERDSLSTPITYHSDRDSFQLVLPSIPQAAPAPVTFCPDQSQSWCALVFTDAASASYIFAVASTHTGWAGIGLGTQTMVKSPLVVGWADSKGKAVQSTRMAGGHGMPIPVTGSLANQIHPLDAYPGITGAISFAFQITYADIQSVLGVMPDGKTAIDFIYAYTDTLPTNRNSSDSAISIHSGKGLFTLVLPAPVESRAAGATMSNARGAGVAAPTAATVYDQGTSNQTKFLSTSQATSAASTKAAQASSNLAPTDLKAAASTLFASAFVFVVALFCV
ncbi:spermatogenesis associated protein 5 [Chytriomyces hyalinus]|nr:spermatogenesis associated protein 5 [Chytriomyces hyalinus]